jgi:hypothetical protein
VIGDAAQSSTIVELLLPPQSCRVSERLRIGGFASLEAASWPARQGYLYFTVCKTAGARRTANQ